MAAGRERGGGRRHRRGGADDAAILEERKFPVRELRGFASERSVGKTVTFEGEAVPGRDASRPRRLQGRGHRDLLGGLRAVEGVCAPMVVKAGAIVVDKSNALRMDPAGAAGGARDQRRTRRARTRASWPARTARPSSPSCRSSRCTTRAGSGAWSRPATRRSRAPASTGSRSCATQTLAWARGEAITPKHFAHQIAFNVIPAIDKFGADGYTGEEMKLVNETRKILELPDLLGLADHGAGAGLHLPLGGGERRDRGEGRRARARASSSRGSRGCGSGTSPREQRYPMPVDVEGQDDCFVGRVREDLSHAERR